MKYSFFSLAINASTTYSNAASAKSNQTTGWGQPLKVVAHPTFFTMSTGVLDMNNALSISPLLMEVLKREQNIKKFRLKKLWNNIERVMS